MFDNLNIHDIQMADSQKVLYDNSEKIPNIRMPLNVFHEEMFHYL